MASVTIGGSTVISNSDYGGNCGWRYTPGHKGNAKQPVVMARARRAKIRTMALQPSNHSLVVTVLGTESDISSFRSRLDNLYERSPGTLSVPGYPSVPFCSLVGQPGWSDQSPAEPTTGGTPQWWYDVTLEILEL